MSAHTCGCLVTVSKMVDLETVMSGLCDEWPSLRKMRFVTLCVVCAIFFFLGLPVVCQVAMATFLLSNGNVQCPRQR